MSSSSAFIIIYIHHHHHLHSSSSSSAFIIIIIYIHHHNHLHSSSSSTFIIIIICIHVIIIYIHHHHHDGSATSGTVTGGGGIFVTTGHLSDPQVRYFAIPTGKRCSSYQAKIKPVVKALQAIQAKEHVQKARIVSDSQSVLLHIQATRPSQQCNDRDEHTVLKTRSCQVTFTWCPGHCGITGNELAHAQAKKRADADQTDVDHHVYYHLHSCHRRLPSSSSTFIIIIICIHHHHHLHSSSSLSTFIIIIIFIHHHHLHSSS